MNDAQQDVYANNLRQNLGYPLRCPNPESSGPDGLRIGDVGHVDESGTFHVLCNIRCPSRSEKFKPVSLDDDLIRRNPTSVLQHSYFTGVKQDTSQKSGFYEFTATAEKGAILILPSGAKLCHIQDRQKLDEFRDLAIEHANRLYQTTSWTLASFYGRRDVDGEKIVVRKSVAEDDDLAAYKWTPEFPNLDPQSCLKDTKFENQTVLIKGFKMKVRPTLGVTVVRPVQESPSFALLLEYLMCLASLLNYLICLASLLEHLKRLASQFEVIKPPITSIRPFPELSREPHYLDIVNNYLLENSKADVVITHDNLWIEMLEKSKSMVIQESELLEHVKGQYDRHSGRNAIWLQRRLGDPNGVLVPKAKISELRVVITHMCAENVTVGLAHIPVGFFVRVEIDDGISWWTENKPALVDDHNIQWNDRIHLPSASSTKVRLVLCASFEFSPVLGSGEPLGTLEICVSDLLERTSAFTIKESIPLLISAQQCYGNYWMSSHVGDSDRKGRSTLPQAINLADEGHHTLLGYYRNHNENDLESSIALFTQALEKCPEDDPRHAVALFNLAKAQFLSDQVHRTHQNFHASTSQFVEALRLRAGDHLDRPMTLLYLSQALLYYRASGLQVSESTLHNYINELETVCPRSTHARHAADLVVQTYELDGLQISDDWRTLNELIPKWARAADEVPEGYFDKAIRFDNIGLALHRRFQLCHDATDLERAAEWFEKAVQITPDGHAQKCTYDDHLNDARLYKWATVVLASCSANEALDAADGFDVPKSHVYWAICDVLEGSNRVLEAIECFRKMRDEPSENRIHNERVWEVDFQRRCVKKLEEQGDISMEPRDLNTAMECYAIALSLIPTNDIIVKCCKVHLLLINAHKFRVYRALCDDLEHSDRVPKALACFHKMQDELAKINFPDDRAEWELDFRRRCVDKIDKKGNGAMYAKDHKPAVGYYSCALSLDPTNVDIIVKFCKARARLLEDKIIRRPKPTAGFSTAPRTNGLMVYVCAVNFSLLSEPSRTAEIESIDLNKYQTVEEEIRKTIRAGESHQVDFSRPIAIDPSDKFRALVKLRKRGHPGRSKDVLILLSLHEVKFTYNDKGERLYRFEAVEGIIVTVNALWKFFLITNRIIRTDSQFRVLVIGNSGVGKSKLIDKIFGIKDTQVSATTHREADIERGFTSEDKQFVVHITLGFGAGDEEYVQIVEDFINGRKKMSQNDQLHAVWLCLEIPYGGGRLFEAGSGKFLKDRKKILGDIPLVVVLTKVDLLDGQLLVDLPKNRVLEDFKSETMMERFIKPLQNAGGCDLKFATVSMGDDYADGLYDLLEATSGNHAATLDPKS